VLAVGNYCYVAVCSAAQGASAPTGEERAGGISWRRPAYCLFYLFKQVLVVSLPLLNFIITQLLCYVFVMQVIVAYLLLMLFTNIFNVMLWRCISV